MRFFQVNRSIRGFNQQKEVSMDSVATRTKQGFNLEVQMGQGPGLWVYERLVVDNENNDKSHCEDGGDISNNQEGHRQVKKPKV
jgi:hypothetical protein